MRRQLRLPFAEAIAYFRGKVPIPTENWKQFDAEQHDFAFTIAGLTKADLLNDAQWLMNRAIADGMGFDEFQKQFQRLIGRKGWTPDPLPAGPEDWRLRIIFETNLRRAYSAGRYQQLEAVKTARPYRMWIHGDTRNPRKSHLALDGKVFPAEHSFWEVATPSCAYGCQCRVMSLSERDLQRLGKVVEEPPDPYTIAEPGFQKAPGTSPRSEREEILKTGLNRLSPELRVQVKKELKRKLRNS